MPEVVGEGMGVAIAILIWVVVGAAIGLVARFILPGAQRVGFFGTIIAGIGGALIAGFVTRSIAEPEWVHIVIAIVGAMILVGLFGLFSRR